MSLSAVDYDMAGRLDIYVCGYFENTKFVSSDSRSLSGDVTYDANTGGNNILFHNEISAKGQISADGQISEDATISADGTWRFTDVTGELGLNVNNHRFSLAASWDDFDNDGDQDFYVANDYGCDHFYRNDLLSRPVAKAERGKADQGIAEQGTAERGTAEQGTADQGTADQGTARHSGAREGGAREGGAREGRAVCRHIRYRPYRRQCDRHVDYVGRLRPRRMDGCFGQQHGGPPRGIGLRSRANSSAAGRQRENHQSRCDRRPGGSNHGRFRVPESEANESTESGPRLAPTASGHLPRIKTLRAGEGFLVQSSKWLHFGLGAADVVQQVIVHWPGGEVEQFTGIDIDHRYRLIQGTSTARDITQPARETKLVHSTQKVPPPHASREDSPGGVIDDAGVSLPGVRRPTTRTTHQDGTSAPGEPMGQLVRTLSGRTERILPAL